jgi:hypothetical protein
LCEALASSSLAASASPSRIAGAVPSLQRTTLPQSSLLPAPRGEGGRSACPVPDTGPDERRARCMKCRAHSVRGVGRTPAASPHLAPSPLTRRWHPLPARRGEGGRSTVRRWRDPQRTVLHLRRYRSRRRCRRASRAVPANVKPPDAPSPARRGEGGRSACPVPDTGPDEGVRDA